MHKIISLLVAAALLAADQGIKQWAMQSLAQQDILLWPQVLHLTYRENYGAAFSILQGKTIFLVALTSVVLLVGIGLVMLGKVRHPLMVYPIMVTVAGGIGNLIDRLVYGFVVDYIYFVPINFPVFNLADCCIVVGMIFVCAVLLLFEEYAR